MMQASYSFTAVVAMLTASGSLSVQKRQGAARQKAATLARKHSTISRLPTWPGPERPKAKVARPKRAQSGSGALANPSGLPARSKGALAAQFVVLHVRCELCEAVAVFERQHRPKRAGFGEAHVRADGAVFGFHRAELDRVEHGRVYHAGALRATLVSK